MLLVLYPRESFLNIPAVRGRVYFDPFQQRGPSVPQCCSLNYKVLIKSSSQFIECIPTKQTGGPTERYSFKYVKYFSTNELSGIEISWSKPISILGTTAIEEQVQPKNITITAARTHFFSRKGAQRCLNNRQSIPSLVSRSFLLPFTQHRISHLKLMLHLVLCGITQLHNANFHEIFLFNNAKMKLYGFYKQDQRGLLDTTNRLECLYFGHEI